MDFLTEHWLSVGVGVFWLSMVLYGHYRGLVRIAVTMSALILSLIVTRVAMPGVTAALNNNTAIHQTIGQGLLHMAGVQGDAENEAEVQPSYQRDMIEKLKLPEQMKEVLLENNNSEIYQMLGVERFFDYLGSYLATMIIRVLGSGILFSVVFLFFPCWNALAESDCKAADPVGTESAGWCAAGCGGWPAVYMAGWAGDQSLLRNAVDTATSDAD